MYLFLPKGVLKNIISLFAKFLWGGSNTSKCQYKVSWKDCCLMKSEGGLGIRDPILQNHISIIFQCWRLVQPNATSLWIMWVNNSLFRNKSFWTAKTPSACPWCVIKMLNVRSILVGYLKYKVGRNSQFKLWHDPWFTFNNLLLTIMPFNVKAFTFNNLPLFVC